MNKEINRRKFLQNTALATAGLTLGSFALATTANTKSRASKNASPAGKRKIGSLEVSPIGLGWAGRAGWHGCQLHG